MLLAILCLTGGLDLIGMLAFGVEPQGEISTAWITLQVPFNLDWWGVPYAPQSFTTNLYYAPQHFFGALIGTALLYASLQFRRPAALTLIESLVVIAASAFWSPYVAVGLAVLAAVMTSGHRQPRDDRSAIETRRVRGHTRAAWPRLLRLCSSPFPRRISVPLGLQASYIS